MDLQIGELDLQIGDLDFQILDLDVQIPDLDVQVLDLDANFVFLCVCSMQASVLEGVSTRREAGHSKHDI